MYVVAAFFERRAVESGYSLSQKNPFDDCLRYFLGRKTIVVASIIQSVPMMRSTKLERKSVLTIQPDRAELQKR